MITGLGVFHFVDGHDRPIAALDGELSKQRNPGGSLIVLPEAFNNGRFYYDEPRMAPTLHIAECLRALVDLATQYQLVFVASLLDPPNNSAVLIRGAGRQLLSHKRTDDASRNYVPWLGPRYANPITIDEIAAAVLLCNEVDGAEPQMGELDACAYGRKIVCIPACMTATYFGSDDLTSRCWSGKYVALANSRADGCGSFITNNKGHKVAKNKPPTEREKQCNEIILKTFDQIDQSATMS